VLSVRAPDGKRQRKWHSGYKTKRDAERALADQLAKLEQGAYVEPSRMTWPSTSPTSGYRASPTGPPDHAAQLPDQGKARPRPVHQALGAQPIQQLVV
jgi:hypothetical protein